MNTSAIKNYAIQARQDFRKLVTEKLHSLGINADGSSVPAQTVGDALVINGVPFPLSIRDQRDQLLALVASQGFEHVVKAMAYTLFNRFCALRYMEVHQYLPQRVFTSQSGAGTPDILANAIDAIGQLKLGPSEAAQLREMKLRGDQDQELYKQLILAQCHALSKAMPFLFEPPNDMTELLMPDGLLHSDSIVRELVSCIPEDDWQSIEIIGWLYQFYISEKKDQVIGKVVKSADIPAATQLFTPNWIVKYMVQNSLGAQWLATYPQSPLKAQMEYYIEPAEQTDEVKAQLAAITPSQLDPESVTLIDPASGSGHILVEAYELFKAIYLEHGYRQRDVPQLILEKNLFGLDIDERAAQLTGFALMMKGRADDRRLFERGVKLNVMALVGSEGLAAEVLAEGVKLADYGLTLGGLTELKRLFEHATTFGSLIQVPEGLAAKLPALKQLSEATSQDLFVSEALRRLGPLVRQAEVLAARYDAVVANPPYMGRKYHNAGLKSWVRSNFRHSQGDLFACFAVRGLSLARAEGSSAIVTLDAWMFQPSYAGFREALFSQASIRSLIHVGWNCFPQGHTYNRGVIFVLTGAVDAELGVFLNLSDVPAIVDKRELYLARRGGPQSSYTKSRHDFATIPGRPVAYWASDAVRTVFADFSTVQDHGKACAGHQTGDNEAFLRRWFEVSQSGVGYQMKSREEALDSGLRWFPHMKGGDFRRWYGNRDYLLDWEGDGRRVRGHKGAALRNPEFMFRPGVTWSHTSSAGFSARCSDEGNTFNVEGPTYFSPDRLLALGFLGSCVGVYLMQLMNPTIHFLVGTVSSLPFDPHRLRDLSSSHEALLGRLVDAHQSDWDAYERSWDFQSLPLLTSSAEPTSDLESSYTAWSTQNRDTIAEMKRLGEENNRLFIDAYGLADELTPDVLLSQITLTVNPAYRYGGKLSEEELWTRFRQDTMQELISYAIGCMMGRYSLDAPGLIYAHSGNEGFDPSKYITFPADEDGIIPILADPYFEDDCTNRIVQFLTVTYGKETLNENLAFLADALGRKNSETPTEAIRRYLATKFFKDHLKTYKKRPIYWLISSGKQRAFQALIYLHRYTPATLSRLRTSYLHELQNKLGTRIDDLTAASEEATTTAAKTRLTKQLATLHKQQTELVAFDEKLHHYADLRIGIDLDDGVKHNYGLFGDLLAEVKAITGKKA